MDKATIYVFSENIKHMHEYSRKFDDKAKEIISIFHMIMTKQEGPQSVGYFFIEVIFVLKIYFANDYQIIDEVS